MILSTGFLTNGITTLLKFDDAWVFFTTNFMWTLISMAMFHNAVETLVQKSMTRVLIFCALPIVNFVCWQFVGLDRLKESQCGDSTSIWLTFLWNLTWSVIIALAALLGCSKNTQDEPCKNYVGRWTAVLLMVLGVRVLLEFALSGIVGYPNDNIVNFIMTVALCFTLVYPWNEIRALAN